MNERNIDLQIEAYIKKELIDSLKSLLEERIKKKRDTQRIASFFGAPFFMGVVGFSPILPAYSSINVSDRKNSVKSSHNEPKFLIPPRREDSFQSIVSVDDVDDINFPDWLDSETFSKMLLRLIKESGKKNSTIYTRANIDRRHFSKIANNPNYQPSKQTVLAFAIALKLDFQATKDLLATAGFILTKSSIADLIVSFFIEHKKYDVDLVNQILYKYNQPLLGG